MNKFKQFLMLFVAFFVAVQLYGQTAAQKQRLEMKQLLHELIKQHTDIGYDNLWAAYATTDVDATGHIIDMYSNNTTIQIAEHWDIGQKWM